MTTLLLSGIATTSYEEEDRAGDSRNLLRIEPWTDPVIDDLGHDPRSHYAETFWLPVLGPSTVWLLRRMAAGLEVSPAGFEIDLDETARALGLGATDRQGRHSPFRRTLNRCVDFDMAQYRAEACLLVRRKLPPLSRRHLVRLPASLQQAHEAYLEGARQLPEVERVRHQGRRLAVSLAEMGEDRQAAELQLMRWGFHPALAAECGRYAFEQSGDPR